MYMKTFKEYVSLREQAPAGAPPGPPPPKTAQDRQRDMQVKRALKTTVDSTGKVPGAIKPGEVMAKADPRLDPEQLAQLTKIAAGGK